MSKLLRQGLVIRMQSGFFTVQTDDGPVICRLRGRLKKGRASGDIAAVGDQVEIMPQPDGTGMVERVLPRHAELVRTAPTPRGVYRQVLVANPDQIVLVFACAEPDPHLRMLDRFLVICERQKLPALIVINKVDLVDIRDARLVFSMYTDIGYPVLYTSAQTGQGIAELHQRLQGKLSGLLGPSGVGKTSLLNAIQPHLGLEVREVSQLTAKGRHTTVVRQMFPLEEGGYVADLPGLRTLALWDIEPEELDGYFPELRPLVADCQFNDCRHKDEPGCAVQQAVADGRVYPERYESYLRLRFAKDLDELLSDETSEEEYMDGEAYDG